MRSHRKIVCLLMSVCFIAVTASTAIAQTGKCGFQTLNFPPPATKGVPVALNDSGAIVGDFRDSHSTGHGFLLFQGKLTSFMFPGSSDTSVTDISRNGIIIGQYFVNGDPKEHAYMVHSGGFHEITLPGFPNADVTVTGVNANGDVVGNFFSPNAANATGFLLHNGKVTILSFPGATGGTLPSSINDQGVIVGIYLVFQENNNFGFMWKDGVFSNINNPPNSIFLESVTKISNSGVIVGGYEGLDENDHGFVFDNGAYTTIDVPGFSSTFILAVNKFDNILVQAEKSTQQGVTTALFKGFCGAAF